MNILVIQEERMPEIALMLAEGFAVIAEDDPQRVIFKATLPQ